MTITRETLELAAKAAGIDVWRGTGHQDDMLFREAQKPNEICTGIHWNPLHDGTDSQELMLKVGIAVVRIDNARWVVDHRDPIRGRVYFQFDPTNPNDLREKIVLCAAEIWNRRNGK